MQHFMRILSLCPDRSRCRWHMQLTNSGYFDYGKKHKRPPIWAPCWEKMSQVLGSFFVYLWVQPITWLAIVDVFINFLNLSFTMSVEVGWSNCKSHASVKKYILNSYLREYCFSIYQLMCWNKAGPWANSWKFGEDSQKVKKMLEMLPYFNMWCIKIFTKKTNLALIFLFLDLWGPSIFWLGGCKWPMKWWAYFYSCMHQSCILDQITFCT